MRLVSLCITLIFCAIGWSQQPFQPLDVFELEYAGDPQISPDGNQIVYRRTGFDILKDKSKGDLWILDAATGSNHKKLTKGKGNESQARWSPQGERIAFVTKTKDKKKQKGKNQIFIYNTKKGKTAAISNLKNSPSSISWSPDGKWIAFSAMVYEAPPKLGIMPPKPKDAQWAKEARITDRFKHEADGRGYIKPGFRHIYIISSQGGKARKLTKGNRNHGGSLQWSPDGNHLYFSGNLKEDWDYDFRNSEIYKLHIQSGDITPLTDRNGPDRGHQISPDGSKIAYLGFDDKVQTYQVSKLYLMNSDGSEKQELQTGLDRSIKNLHWSQDGNSLYFMYDDKGTTKLAKTTLAGSVTNLVDNIGGTTLGRPYASGSYTVSNNGLVAYTHSQPMRPAEVATIATSTSKKILTQLNADLLNNRTMGAVEELWYTSSVDGRDIQGWIVYPPNYENGKSYPLLVENHGGPILNYGDRFSAEIQLYAAAGYVVFYPNPRGSTGYGEEFGNLLYNNYPGEDYNDVMDGVDACLAKGITSEDQLYVTGGSAGGIMTAWMIGKNNRFEAAVVAKPVMNWLSKTLVADNYYGYANSRYPGQPWENFEGYWKFSPISLVGNIETPTMVMVGMNDLRTPPSEAKQLYHALKIRKKETMLVEIPGASHGIASRPSNLVAKVLHTLAWFEKYRKD